MTVSEQIIQVIDALCEKFGLAINWTNENVIPYVEILCRKLIAYEVGTSIAWMVIMISLSVGSVIATKKLVPVFQRNIAKGGWNNDWDIGAGFAIAGLVVLNLVTLIVICVQTMDIIKCAAFPEMYIFEYVSKLIQQ